MSIGVYARVRPVPGSEAGVLCNARKIQIKNLEFALDHTFDGKAKQAELYDIIGKDRVPRVLAGENCTFICYGQTGSGKTHTMFGPNEVLADWGCAPDEHGLAPRAISQLFDAVAASGTACTVQCTYVEVYNDSVNDLLGQKKALPLREAPRGVNVEGLAQVEVSSLDDAMRVLARGNAQRVVGAMKMNARSSRGHAIFTLFLQSRSGDAVASGKLVLVDLAGMESSKKSYSTEGESSKPHRREEARHINTSLFALGSVVEKLSAAKKGGGGHVPYRNSKLTRLLQDSVGGSSACAVVVTLRAEKENLEECVSTLRFAQRATAVPVVVKSNVATAAPDPVALVKELRGATEELTEARALIEELQRERGSLQRQAEVEAEAAAAAEAAKQDAASAKAEAEAAKAAAEEEVAAAAAAAQRELVAKEDALNVARLQIEQLHARMAEMMEEAAAGGAAARKELEAEVDLAASLGRPSLGASIKKGASMRASRRAPAEPKAAEATPAARPARRARGDFIESSAHEAALDDYLDSASPVLKRLSTSQANTGPMSSALLADLDDVELYEELTLSCSLRPGQVPLALVHAQLDALADAEEDIEAELADLDVIDLASEVPILSDAARRVMQFAQLSRFMKAGVMPELGIQRRPAGPPDFDGPDFSIGDLHRLVLELPSVPVEKLRRELDLIGETARAMQREDEEDACLGRTMLKSQSAAMVAAARA